VFNSTRATSTKKGQFVPTAGKRNWLSRLRMANELASSQNTHATDTTAKIPTTPRQFWRTNRVLADTIELNIEAVENAHYRLIGVLRLVNTRQVKVRLQRTIQHLINYINSEHALDPKTTGFLSASHKLESRLGHRTGSWHTILHYKCWKTLKPNECRSVMVKDRATKRIQKPSVRMSTSWMYAGKLSSHLSDWTDIDNRHTGQTDRQCPTATTETEACERRRKVIIVCWTDERLSNSPLSPESSFRL